VIVVEDGPTITHGGMSYGAGYVAAVAAGATIVDPRVNADPAMRAVFAQYPHIGKVVPAIGYDAAQLARCGRRSTAPRPTWWSRPRRWT
jgi:predicted GTPase